MQIPESILNVMNILQNHGYECYLVGGCVRDFLMGITPHDFDLTTNALPEEMLSVFSGMRIIETGLKHGTVTVVSDGENVEITTYRVDGAYLDNRHPESVSFTRNLRDDLSRRDFTSNAIAYNPDTGYVDIFGGIDDIKLKLIRSVGDADTRFNEDGLRIIRALRFSSTLNFSIHPVTSDAVFRNKELLRNISSERIYTEMKKLLNGSDARKVMSEYFDVFCVIFPGLAGYRDLYMDNCSLLPFVPDDSVLSFASLFMGMDKPDIASFLRCLKPDNYLYDNVRILTDYASQPVLYDEISVRYLMKSLSGDNILRLSVLKGIYDPDFDKSAFDKQYEHQLTIGACTSVKALAINGRDIIESGISSGPQIGKITNALLDAVIENKCKNERAELLEYINKVK